MIPNLFSTTLRAPLAEKGNETEILVNSLKTKDGQTINISDFARLGNVGYLVIEGGTERVEYVKFTGIDTQNNKFTGITRGLSFTANNDNRVENNVKYHPVGASVEIVDNTHYLNHFVDKNSNETISGVKTFTSIPVIPTSNPSLDGHVVSKKYIDQVLTGEIGSATETSFGWVKTDKPVLASEARVIAVSVHQQSTPNMTLYVEPFSFVWGDKIINFNGGSSPTFSSPSSYPRIDLLVYSISTSQLAIRQGTEAANPQPPTPNSGDYVICSVYHRVGETSIKDKSDGTNGYILRHYNSYYDDSSFVRTSGNQTISGIKTFTSIPVLPSTDPVNDNDAVRKKYVDDSLYKVVLVLTKPIDYSWVTSPISSMTASKTGDDNYLFKYVHTYGLVSNPKYALIRFKKISSNPKYKIYRKDITCGGNLDSGHPTNSITVMGNYVYRITLSMGVVAVFRHNINDLSDIMFMYFNGPRPETGTTFPNCIVNDGTYIYISRCVNPINWYKYSVSGNTLTYVDNIYPPSDFNSPANYTDGTYLYNVGTSEEYAFISKYSIPSFTLVGTYNYPNLVPAGLEGLIFDTDNTFIAFSEKNFSPSDSIVALYRLPKP